MRPMNNRKNKLNSSKNKLNNKKKKLAFSANVKCNLSYRTNSFSKKKKKKITELNDTVAVNKSSRQTTSRLFSSS